VWTAPAGAVAHKRPSPRPPVAQNNRRQSPPAPANPAQAGVVVTDCRDQRTESLRGHRRRFATQRAARSAGLVKRCAGFRPNTTTPRDISASATRNPYSTPMTAPLAPSSTHRTFRSELANNSQPCRTPYRPPPMVYMTRIGLISEEPGSTFNGDRANQTSAIRRNADTILQ
jgi:hypothetical protein